MNPERRVLYSDVGTLASRTSIKYAVQMGPQDFQASHGWLYKFCKAHNMCKTVSGESADADFEAAETFKARIPGLCKQYSPADVYNADKTMPDTVL
ncbi:MAG: hypothetical protein GY696_18420 [Gammaproteobacteria bacterium]|nr:hypothetical protein [Gammaproteobacteria bacterium]